MYLVTKCVLTIFLKLLSHLKLLARF